MPRLSETIARLKSLRLAAGAPAAGAPVVDRLSDLADFGPNPGELRARLYVPEVLAPGAALVVVLHGCTQSAASYDHGAGWSQLADRHGFALLFPEQSHANNPAGCFNWFVPGDVRRGDGEAKSVHQMILATIDAHEIDPRRVFVTGLSAGAAFAVAMLAAYPEVFAGGAAIAGLPYGCAGSVPEALKLMRGHGLPLAVELESTVRSASPHPGPWPTLSVWHGSADHTVSPANAEAIVSQWRALHDLEGLPDAVEVIGSHSRRTWLDATGGEMLEAWSIAGMGHGTPIDAGPEGCGTPGPFMLDVGISSTQHIAHRWNLAPAPVAATGGRIATVAEKRGSVEAADAKHPAFARRDGRVARPVPATSRVGQVIEDALRAAGLMR